jgi:hypothetical protein
LYGKDLSASVEMTVVYTVLFDLSQLLSTDISFMSNPYDPDGTDVPGAVNLVALPGILRLSRPNEDHGLRDPAVGYRLTIRGAKSWQMLLSAHLIHSPSRIEPLEFITNRDSARRAQSLVVAESDSPDDLSASIASVIEHVSSTFRLSLVHAVDRDDLSWILSQS